MIKYAKGNAIDPVKLPDTDCTVICHVCNDIGKWGKGFVLPLGRKYPIARQVFIQESPMELGTIQLITQYNNWVCNMVSQHKIKTRFNPNYIPFSYSSFEACLDKLGETLSEYTDKKFSIAGPRMGAGLAGGDWLRIERLLNNFSEKYDLPVVIYDLP